jgi:hypothetical protein
LKSRFLFIGLSQMPASDAKKGSGSRAVLAFPRGKRTAAFEIGANLENGYHGRSVLKKAVVAPEVVG